MEEGLADPVAAARGRHLAWCLALAREAESHLRGPDQGAWLARLEAEHANLRAGLEWAAQGEGADSAPAADMGLRMAGALGTFWLIRGHLQEGRTYAAALLARADAQAPTPARAGALNTAAMLATEQGDLAPARALHEEALSIARTLGDRLRLLTSLNNLAIVVYDAGDSPAARTLWREALAVARAGGDPTDAASPLANLGELAFEEGDPEAARPLLEEALALHRQGGRKFNVAYVLKVLATLTHQQGDFEAARRYLTQSLPIQQDIGHRAGIAQTLEAAAALAASSARADFSACLSGAAAALRAEIAAPLPANERERHAQTVAAARAALGEAPFEAAFQAGRAMTWEGAVEYALAESE